MSRIQIRRGTAAQWATTNPTLYAGEFGYETDTNKVKLGNGTSAWNSLAYVSFEWDTFAGLSATLTNKTISGSTNTLSDIPQSAVTGLGTALAAKEDAANKGQAGGYASLDGGGKVPVSQLPASIMQYQGVWDVSTNTPTLSDGTGSVGDVYRVTVAGDRDLGSGSTSFQVGDYAILNSDGVWEKSDTTDAVSSVNGYTGIIVLTASDVGLGSVDDTADAAKSVLSATKLTTARNINGVAFDGTADVTVADSTKEPVITAGTTGQYWRGDKSWQALNKSAVGLSNVDNTSDATKNAASATLANKTISGADNTLTNIAQSSVTDLTTDLASKEATANKGQANGYAALDGDGLVPLAQLPVTQADWTTLEGKPAVIAAGATAADARTAIDAEYTGNKGQPGGYASLDSGGHIPLSQWGAQVVDGGSAAASTVTVIDGGTA